MTLVELKRVYPYDAMLGRRLERLVEAASSSARASATGARPRAQPPPGPWGPSRRSSDSGRAANPYL